MSSQNNTKISPMLLVGVSLSLAATFAVIVVLLLTQQSNGTSQQENAVAIFDSETEYTGITDLEPAEPIADFTLTNTAGEPVEFADFQGKWVMLYFGFTFCPDFCPATLLNFKQIKSELGEDAENVTFMMISVDGERDTPEALLDYLERYDPEFVGLTGTEDELTPVVSEFGAQFQKRENPGSEYYTVDHTVSIFLINPQGEWTTLYSYGTEVETIVEDLKGKL